MDFMDLMQYGNTNPPLRVFKDRLNPISQFSDVEFFINKIIQFKISHTYLHSRRIFEKNLL